MELDLIRMASVNLDRVQWGIGIWIEILDIWIL